MSGFQPWTWFQLWTLCPELFCEGAMVWTEAEIPSPYRSLKLLLGRENFLAKSLLSKQAVEWRPHYLCLFIHPSCEAPLDCSTSFWLPCWVTCVLFPSHEGQYFIRAKVITGVIRFPKVNCEFLASYIISGQSWKRLYEGSGTGVSRQSDTEGLVKPSDIPNKSRVMLQSWEEPPFQLSHAAFKTLNLIIF